MRLTFKAPFTVLFSITAIVLYVLFQQNDTLPRVFVLHGDFQFTNLQWYVSLIGYTMGHVSVSHLVGNISLFILLGHIVEKRYGWRKMFLMISITGFITALIHISFFEHKLVGASGIVFMMIVLSSLIDIKAKEIPITFILIFLLFVGKEILESFQSDSISQFAHITGGIIGTYFGYRFKRSGTYV